MSRQCLPSPEESIEFFDRSAGTIMQLGDRLVHSPDPRTAHVGRVVFSLLCHGLSLALGRDQAQAGLRRLVDELNRSCRQQDGRLH